MQRILILWFFVFALSSQAQVQSRLYVDGVELSKLSFKDSLKLIRHVNELQVDWVNKGFYFAGIDSVFQSQNETLVYLHKGERRKAFVSGLKGRKLESHISKQLKGYANAGYPFASIRLDSTRWSNEAISGIIDVKPGPEIVYDSSYFFNELKTNHSYIYQLLDLKPGELFSEKNYRLIKNKVERSTFLNLNRPTDLAFKDKKAVSFLDLTEESSSSFQGILGLQQDQSGGTTAVGTLQLDMQNLFRSGKEFKFKWERFAAESQNLSVFYKHPFFLDSKISPSFRFDLLKQDTTFLSRSLGIGLHTYIAPRIEMFIEYESTNGTLLTSDLDIISASGLADFQRRVYSLNLSKGHSESLGSYINGLIWRLSASGGTKDIQRNLSLPDSYYDSLQIETNFFRFEALTMYQVKILKRQTLFHQFQLGVLQNDELLRNELYRIGGLSSLRGFNEKEFFVKSYALSRLEFRSFFENRSFAFLFYDQLIFQNDSGSDQPFGLGLGFALETSAGQFSFALAGGHSNEQSISFSTMKVHFGYTSRF